jgi:hypothetical protein
MFGGDTRWVASKLFLILASMVFAQRKAGWCSSAIGAGDVAFMDDTRLLSNASEKPPSRGS